MQPPRLKLTVYGDSITEMDEKARVLAREFFGHDYFDFISCAAENVPGRLLTGVSGKFTADYRIREKAKPKTGRRTHVTEDDFDEDEEF